MITKKCQKDVKIIILEEDIFEKFRIKIFHLRRGGMSKKSLKLLLGT